MHRGHFGDFDEHDFRTYGCLARTETFRMRRLFCLIWKKTILSSVYSIIKMPVTAFPSAGTSGSAVFVCVFYTVWTDQLLDALLCILNLWLFLRTDLGPDVKSFVAQLHF